MKKILLALCCLAATVLPAGAQTFTGFDLNMATGPNTSSFPGEFVELNNKVYFFAADATGFGLWQSDGTPAGTSLLKRVSFGGNLVYYGLTAYNGKLYFHGEATPGEPCKALSAGNRTARLRAR